MTTEAIINPDTHEIATVAQLAAHELGEIKAQFELARAYPRDEDRARKAIMKSCERPTFADAAVYEFPRKKRNDDGTFETVYIRGLSINAAREVTRLWGNIRRGYRQLPTDPAYIHLSAYAYDLETGSFVEKQDRFLRRIPRKGKGNVTAWDEPNERDLRELVGRRAALLERNAMLELVPADLKEEMLASCIETGEQATKKAMEKSRPDVLARMVACFAEFGVTRSQIETYVSAKIEELTADQLQSLKRVYGSLKDGQSTVEDYFPTDVDAPAEPGSGG